ncbi:MAG: tetratricopeptide repeat protein [Planctomycetota bacterium]
MVLIRVERRRFARVVSTWVALALLFAAPSAVPLRADEKPAGKPAALPNNLELPNDMPDNERKVMVEAIDAYRAALRGTRDAGEKVDVAVRRAKRATEVAKSQPLAWYYLGSSYYAKRDFKRAAEALEKALSLKPDFYEARYQLGDVAQADKKFEVALGHFDLVLAIAPAHMEALLSKAFMQITLGRYEDAKPTLATAKQVDASNRDAEFLDLRLDRVLKGNAWSQEYKVETENYIIVTNVSEAYAAEIGERAELIRRLYTGMFPEIAKPTRKYEVTVYGSQQEYHAAGGPPSAGGHYDPIFRRLYLFRYEKPEDTILVLNHEGLHQFLHDYLEAAPQWFNEGVADFFGPAVKEMVDGRAVMRVKPNWWRLDTVREARNRGLLVPAAELMNMSQREMYGEKAAICYAQAWAIVYYCCFGPNESHRKLLNSYWGELRKNRGIHEAYDRTFGKINMDKFEEDWQRYIMKVINEEARQ